MAEPTRLTDGQESIDRTASMVDGEKYVQSIECAKAALKLNPQYASAHALMGESLLLTGDIPGARKHLKEAARLDPRWKEKLKLLPPE